MKRFFRMLKEESGTIIKVITTPIISLLIVTFAYSNVFVENIPFGIVDNDNSSLSRNIVAQLKNHPGLDVSYYAESESDLEEKIRSKQINGGIVIPQGFSHDLSLKNSPCALLLVDGTNMTIGGNALSYSATVMGTLTAGIQLSTLQGRNMYPSIAQKTIGNFSVVERTMYEPQGGYTRNMVYTLIPLVLQMVFLIEFLIPLLIKRKDVLAAIPITSKEFWFNILDIIGRILLVSISCIASSFFALCIVRKMYCLPLKGDILIYAIFMAVFFINLVAMALFFASFMRNMTYFVQGYHMFNTAFMLTCGIVYPLYMMPEKLVAVLKGIWPLIHVGLPLKFLNLKGVGWDVLYPYLLDSFKYASLWLPFGLILYSGNIAYQKYNLYVQEAESQNIDDLSLELS